ncbi:hypothetical protein GGH96_003307 [Coemansia sp. RSA 1972]|nr:hypothetical protein GGH96_003307 [Coemansia sp. RSA 1972]
MDTSTDDIAQVLMNISYTQELREIVIRETRHIREQSPSSTNTEEDIARIVSANILVMQDSLDIEYKRKSVKLLLRPAITLNANAFPRVSEFLDRPIETTADYDTMLVNIESKAEEKNVESAGVAQNTSNVLLITGCAGSGKTHILHELAIRSVWKTEDVRIVYIHDFQTWARDSDAEAILYFVEKVKSAFIQDADFNDALQLGVHIGTTAGSICAQVLMAVKAYCIKKAKNSVPLKVLFCIDNYCQAKSSSLASKFMQMVCDYTSTMFVVAAVFDARAIGNNRSVKLPHAYHRTEAAAVITVRLIHECTHSIARIWRVDQPRLLAIVQRYTMFNPLEVTELFHYAKSARSINDFVQLASEFVCAFQSALPNLGSMHDFGFTCSDCDTVDYVNNSAKKTLLQAYFHLQARTPSHFQSQNFADSAMMDYHPCIRYNILADGHSVLQFSAPRMANYMLHCTFGDKCPLSEMSGLLGTSDQDRYDMAYAATMRLAQTPGPNIGDVVGPTTLHTLVETEAHDVYSEIRGLKRAVLGPQAVALVVQSEACGVRELSRTKGVDFGSRSATGESAMSYIVAGMVSSDGDMRAIMQALSINHMEAVGNAVPMSPMKRVVTGVNEALKLRELQNERREIEVILLGTSATVTNMDRCVIKDPMGRFAIKVVDITDVNYNDGHVVSPREYLHTPVDSPVSGGGQFFSAREDGFGERSTESVNGQRGYTLEAYNGQHSSYNHDGYDQERSSYTEHDNFNQQRSSYAEHNNFNQRSSYADNDNRGFYANQHPDSGATMLNKSSSSLEKQSPAKRRKRRCCGNGRYCWCFSKRCCLIFLPILAVILAGVGVTLYYVFPRIPVVTFERISVAQEQGNTVEQLLGSASINRQGVVTVPLIIHLNVTNPNFIPWTIHNVTVDGFLANSTQDDFPVGEGGLREPFKMPKKTNTNDMPIYFNFRLSTDNDNYLSAAQTVQKSCSAGGPSLRFKYKAKIILKAISWLGIKPVISDTISFACPVSEIESLGINISDLTGLAGV